MRLLIAFACLLGCAAFLPAQVINEIIYDDESTDDREFIEIYNNTAATIPGGTLSVENRDGGGVSLMGVVVITGAIPPGGYYVVGNAAVPNVNQVVVINSLENDEESNILRDVASGTILDAVAYETNLQQPGFPAGSIEGQGIWGNKTTQLASNQSWSRYQDGLDTNDNGADFGLLPATPGATNNIATVAIPYANNFDAVGTEIVVAGWTASFVAPFIIDPTVASLHNPTAIVPSPQGGNAMVVMDPTGGGNMAMLVSTPAADFDFEAWVYLRTGIIPPGTAPIPIETWSIGVRGTTDTFHNHPAPNGLAPPTLPALQPNGNTGIAWEYLYSALTGNGTLRLVEEGNGGADEVTLATYAITSGVNDGWQRLRLAVAGDVIDANFGGVLGAPNTGSRTLALTSYTGIGTFYVGYRELVDPNSQMRPVTIDDMTLITGTVPYSCFLRAPSGSGSIQFDDRGLIPGVETWNIFSFEPCAGGPGTGPYLGLCSSDLNILLGQFFQGIGTDPFHILPASTTYTFGPFTGIPAGIPIEAISLNILGAYTPVAAFLTF